MGNHCGKEKGEQPPYIISIDNDYDDSMFKEYIHGKHDIIDKMKIQGDSFLISKFKNIEIIDLDNIGDVNSSSNSNPNSMPDLVSVTSSWEEHNYGDSDCSYDYDDSVSTYGTRSSPDRCQRNPSFASCLCDPSHSDQCQDSDADEDPHAMILDVNQDSETDKDSETDHTNQDSDSMSSFSEFPRVIYTRIRHERPTQTLKDVEKNKFEFSTPVSRRTTLKRRPSGTKFSSFSSFHSFDKKNWLWMSLEKSNRNKSAKVGPGRSLQLTPIISNIPPPFLSRLSR